MRFVHYYPRALGDSGVTSALWSWARALAATGFEVSVLHADPIESEVRGGFADKRPAEGLSRQVVPHRGSRRMTIHPVRLERYLGRGDVLVLHEGWVPSNMVAAAAARRAGVPYVLMPHGVYDAKWTRVLKPPRFLRNALERRVIEGAAAVHVFFPSEMADILALAPGATCIAQPTGFEVPEERWRGGGGYVSWIGRIDPVHKGLDLIVEALARLERDERPELRLHGYDYKGGIDRLLRLVRSRSLERWVTIRPVIAGREKTRFLCEADGYVHPSRWECHSIALLENLGHGVPSLVSSAIHIAPELDRSEAAVLAAPSEASLADGLRRLAQAGSELAGRARAFIENRFAWKRVVPEYIGALNALGIR